MLTCMFADKDIFTEQKKKQQITWHLDLMNKDIF